MSSIVRRLTALEARRTEKDAPFGLFLVRDEDPEPDVVVCGDQTFTRAPGEPWETFRSRCLAEVDGPDGPKDFLAANLGEARE